MRFGTCYLSLSVYFPTKDLDLLLSKIIFNYINTDNSLLYCGFGLKSFLILTYEKKSQLLNCFCPLFN